MKDYTAEDRAQREKLERMSSAGSRADVCGILNKMVAGDAARELPGLAAYGLIRGDAGGDYHAAARAHNRLHDRLMADGAFNRLHPDLARAAAGRVKDAGGSVNADAGTRAKYGGDGVREIEPEWLTIEQMRVIAGVKARASRYL